MKSYGCWIFDSERLTIECDRGGYPYEIDLETCTSSAEILDWIMQIAGKTWADAEVIADLVRAFKDLVNPQATLCSFGTDKRMTKAQVAEEVLAAS